MVLQGRLDEISLMEALQLLAASAQSGVLRLTGSFSGTVFLRDGAVTFAEADRCQPLEEALARAGARLPGGRGGFRVDWSHETAQLEAVVRQNVVDVVFELMVLSEGDFEFMTGQTDPWGSPFAFRIESLARDVERQVVEWKNVAEAIPPMTAKLRMVARLPLPQPEVAVTADEWQMLASLDGWTTVADLVAESHMRPFDACRALQGLVVKALVVTLGEPEPGR